MKLPRPTLRKLWFPLAVTIVLATAFTALLAEGLKNAPHYCYVDEGHVVLNLSAIFSGKMPRNVAYGPTVYFVFAAVGLTLDPVWAFFGEPTYFDTVIRNVHRPLFYNDYRPYWILPVGRAISILATLLGLLFAALAISKRHPGLRLLCLLATLSIPLYLQGSFFITTEPMALLFFGLVILVSTRANADSGALALAGFAAALVFLANVKVFYCIYLVLGILALYKRSPETFQELLAPLGAKASRLRLTKLMLFGIALIIALNWSYRSLSQWHSSMSWAISVYHKKQSVGSLITTFFSDQAPSISSGPLIHTSHAVVMMLGLSMLLLRRQRLQEFLLAFLGFFQLFYFLNVPWQVYRNVYALPLLFIYLAMKNFSLAYESFSAAGKTAAKILTTALSAWFAFLAFAGLFIDFPRHSGDTRIDFVANAPISTSCEGPVFVDIQTQIHEIVFERAGIEVEYFHAARDAERLQDLAPGTCIVTGGSDEGSGPTGFSTLYESGGRHQLPAAQIFIRPSLPVDIRLLKVPADAGKP